MTLVQIIIALVVLIGFAVLWALATKGVDQPLQFTDVDKDGAPDATPHEKEAAIEAFHQEQVRRHPEDFPKPDNKPSEPR